MTSAPADLVVTTGAAANGGSCVARHEGRVIFVRYALPGETVRVRVTAQRGSYWNADAVDIIEPSEYRIDPLCPIAGVDGSGCCDLAFADPRAVRALKGEVVANQLARLGDYAWSGEAERVGAGDPRGWRTRVRLAVGTEGRAGFHRYHSDELIHQLHCGQLADGLVDGLDAQRWPGVDHVHVVLDDDGVRHIASTARQRRGTLVAEGSREAVQRVGGRRWRLPVTAFWQSHREAPEFYSALVAQWAASVTPAAASAWDLYGGAGLFAAALAGVLGGDAAIATVDTARAASAAARTALADLPGVTVVGDSVRKFLERQSVAADIAVLDPPRAGAGADVIALLAGAGVGAVIHIGCEAAAFARDVGLYRRHGYTVQSLRVFDAFPLTHHVECFALLTR